MDEQQLEKWIWLPIYRCEVLIVKRHYERSLIKSYNISIIIYILFFFLLLGTINHVRSFKKILQKVTTVHIARFSINQESIEKTTTFVNTFDISLINQDFNHKTKNKNKIDCSLDWLLDQLSNNSWFKVNSHKLYYNLHMYIPTHTYTYNIYISNGWVHFLP